MVELLLALGVGAASAERADWTRPGPTGLALGASFDYGLVPDRILDMFYDEHDRLQGVGGGVTVGWYRSGFTTALAFSTLRITTPDGVWLPADAKPDKAEWVELDMTLLPLSLRFVYDFPLGSRFGLAPHLGWGQIWRLGTAAKFRTVGEGALESREKAPNAKGKSMGLPKKFRRTDAGLALRWSMTDHLELSASAAIHLLLLTRLQLTWRT